MSGPATSTTTVLTPLIALEILRARCEAKAHLFSIGEYDLHDAVDDLQHHAEWHGLVRLVGQDRVQRVIAEAFKPVRAGEEPS